SFLPAAENQPRALRKMLHELHVLSDLPVAVLLLHQASAVRTRARGSLPAFADILIDMQSPPGDRLTRLRHFHGVGRYPCTFQYAAAELNPEGTDYVLVDGAPDAALAPPLETVRRLLSQSHAPLTRQEILAGWPECTPVPRPDSLWRIL